MYVFAQHNWCCAFLSIKLKYDLCLMIFIFKKLICKCKLIQKNSQFVVPYF